MNDPYDEDLPEPPQVRRLRRLSMALMVVLMLGIVTIAGVIVIRLGFAGGAQSVTADEIVLPAGEIVSVGQGNGTILFVLRGASGDVLHVFDSATGEPLSQTRLNRE